MNCKNLKNVEFPAKLETISRNAFMGSGLETATLPASLRTVCQGVFAKCEYLKKACFGEGLEVLGRDEYPRNEKFYNGIFGENALEEVWLPSTLKRIEYATFNRCKRLKKVLLPDSLETISWGCFANTGLEELILPKNVKTVGPFAFYTCKRLRSVQLNEGLEKLGEE